MPTEKTSPASNEIGQIENMEIRRKHLDSLFEIALVLLGVLSASEFQYYLTTEEKALHFYALRVFTVPILVLIIFWLAKELMGDLPFPKVRMLMTEFCWNFWSFTLFYYLLGIYGGLQIGITLSFLLSIAMGFSIQLAYRMASPVTSGDRSMFKYYKSPLWIGIRSAVFVGAYLLLVRIVLP